MFFALVLTVTGIVLLRGTSLTSGGITTLLALVLFFAASSKLKTTAISSEDLADLLRTWLPLSLTLLGLFLSAISAYEASLPNTATSNRLAVTLWVLGLCSFIEGILWFERWQLPVGIFVRWARQNRSEFLVLLSILILGLIARTYALSYHPYPWTFDEAEFGIQGRAVLTRANIDFFSAGWSSIPTLAYYPMAFGVAIFGDSILAVRTVSAVVGTLSVLSMFLFTRELFDRKIALLSAAFAATFPLDLQFSRLGLNNIFDLLLVTLVLWLVIRAVHGERLSNYALAGIAAGLTLYASVGGRLILLLALGTLAYASISMKVSLRNHGRQIILLLLGVVVTIAPLAVYFLQNPDAFNARVNQVGIIQSGWLSHQLAIPGTTLFPVLWGQFTRSTLVYVAQGSSGLLFSTHQPYLTFIAALLFLLGMTYTLQHALDLPFAILLAWFWSVVFVGGVLTIDPPASTRQVLTAPAVAVFVALGMSQILEILGYVRIAGPWQLAVGTALVGFLMAQNAYLYFGVYRSSHVFDDPTAEVAAQAGWELQSLGPRFSLYMLGQPSVSAAFPPFQFLAPSNQRTDVASEQAAGLDLAGRTPAIVIATPNNLVPLQAIAQRYPGGKWETVPSQDRSGALYYAYVLDKAVVP